MQSSTSTGITPRRILIVLAVVFVVCLAFLFYVAIKRGIIRIGNRLRSGDTPSGVFPLYYGAGMGERADAQYYVEQVQEFCNVILRRGGRDTIALDGKWGDNTEGAVAFVASSTTGYVTADGGLEKGQYKVTEDQHRQMLSFLAQNQ